MDIYSLSRNFWDYAFENPEKISPNHAAIYFFAIEHCNRLGWKQKFGFPSQMTMDAIGIKKHQTYIRYFEDLCEWGFFKLVQKSKNQYSANIISLISAMPKNGKALDKAIIKHTAKQTESNGQSNSSVDIPIYKDTNIQGYKDTETNVNILFECFVESEKWVELWNRYIDFRKTQHKFKYATFDTEKTAIENFIEISDKDFEIAQKIVVNTISSGYRGLFPIKESKKIESRKVLTD